MPGTGEPKALQATRSPVPLPVRENPVPIPVTGMNTESGSTTLESSVNHRPT